VDKAESEKERAFAINAVGAGNLAQCCRVHRTRLIHLSTDYVFDGAKSSPYTEDDATGPVNAYGASKLEGERLIAEADPVYLILRVSWVFSSIGSNFVKTMLRFADRETLRVVDDQYGTPCAAADIAAAIWLSAGNLPTTRGGLLLHFSSHPPVTWFGFAKMIFETARSLGMVAKLPRLEAIAAKDYPAAARRPSNSLMDSSRLQRLIGLDPPDWRKSLRKVLEEIMRDVAVAR